MLKYCNIYVIYASANIFEVEAGSEVGRVTFLI